MFELPTQQQDFYQACAEILKVPHEFAPRYTRRPRWNNRTPGNGRFPGRGTIRWFSSDHIHMAFHTPAVTLTFSNPDQCLAYLRTLTDQFLLDSQ